MNIFVLALYKWQEDSRSISSEYPVGWTGFTRVNLISEVL